MFLLLLLVTAVAGSEDNSTEGAPQCQSQYIGLSTGCYHFSGVKRMNWYRGSEYCRALGGDLVAFETTQELSAVNSYLLTTNHQGQSWIGGYDTTHEFNWYWLSSFSPMKVFYWNNGEPNAPGGIQHCVATLARGLQYRWNNRNCNLLFSVICEYRSQC